VLFAFISIGVVMVRVVPEISTRVVGIPLTRIDELAIIGGIVVPTGRTTFILSIPGIKLPLTPVEKEIL